MTTLLETLAQQEAAALEEAKESYREIVQRLADGRDDPELSLVQAVLTAVGKTADNLRHDVTEQKRLDGLREKIQQSELSQVERLELLEKRAALVAQMEAAQQKHRQDVWPIECRIAEINQLAMEASTAQQELIRSCRGEDLLNREASIRQQIEHTNELIKAQSALIGRIAANLQILKSEQAPDESAIDAKRVQLSTEQAKLDKLRAEIADLVNECHIRI